MTKDPIFISLDSADSSVLSTETLLPIVVYEQLEMFITKAIRNLPDLEKSLNETRSHNAISIDGARGTGKTSVLVNIKRYLERNNKQLLEQIHIIEPIDPTLLEEGESLFLHVIVAAILHDETVKSAQLSNPDSVGKLNKALEKLANALESIDIQKDLRGMDKIRALYGNKHLADCVQTFFRAALELLGKKILILPIDDVDTSLNHAFENLEIIRRYLTTRYALPIVSGDRSLYDEVTWRDFHGRLLRDSSYKQEQASLIAENLANEYQRKILPLPYRLTMPAVNEYLQNPNIQLRGKNENTFPLRNFHAWLEIFIAGPVNGLENSHLTIPIPSIRALSQLINHCGERIMKLPKEVREAETTLAVKRSWQMPTVSLVAMENFHKMHQDLTGKPRREFRHAYDMFSKSSTQKPKTLNDTTGEHYDWTNWLAEYFRFEANAGEVYLVLLAKRFWLDLAKNKSKGDLNSIFDTPLFQPLLHAEHNYNSFDKAYDLSSWQELNNRLPADWLSKVTNQKTILPYPLVEVGINSAKNWRYWKELSFNSSDFSLEGKSFCLISLLTHHNYYTNAKQSMMLNIGRIFELIISSIVGPVNISDMQRMSQGAPFFSTSAIAPTKVIGMSEHEREETVNSYEDKQDPTREMIEASFLDLQNEIAAWRERHDLENAFVSPWIVYKVFNKVFSQVSSSELVPRGMKDVNRALEIVGLVFYSTWSAFGSFEKGQLFGLPNVIATVNLNSPYNFYSNDHYHVNVGPFSSIRSRSSEHVDNDSRGRNIYGKSTGTISYFLADHPLKKWIDSILKSLNENSQHENDTDDDLQVSARKWLLDELDLPRQIQKATNPRIKDALRKINMRRLRSLIDHANQEHHGTEIFDLLESVHSDRSRARRI